MSLFRSLKVLAITSLATAQLMGCATTGSNTLADRPNCKAGANGYTQCVVTTDDGVKIAYKTIGTGKKNLVLVHGWAGAANNFDEMIKSLDLSAVRAIALDLRGHGDSDKTELNYTDERFAKDILAVADDAKAAQFTVLGFSMSGRFVQYVQLLAPTRVLNQVLVASGPVTAFPLPEPMIADWVSRVGDIKRLREVPAQFAVSPNAALLDDYARNAAKVSRTGLEKPLRLSATSFEAELKAKAPVTRTLCVAGGGDKMLGTEVQKAICANYAGSKVEVIDNCGHEVLIEKPKELAALVSSFLGSDSNGPQS